MLGNVRLPALLLVGSSAAAASGANIGVSAVAAATAAVAHLRAGRVRWRLVAWMLGPSVAGAVAGALLAGVLPSDALLVVIGVVLLVFGVDLLRPRRRGTAAEPAREPDVRAAAAAGAAIGFLGGLVGLILGALRLPTLLRLGEEPRRAIGTNLVVGVAVGVAGLLGHAPAGVDWTLLAVGAAASVPGALLGARLTGRLSDRRLLQAVGAILLVAGTAAVVQGVVD